MTDARPPSSEIDELQAVAKMLSQVQQSRAELELQCALTETQEQCPDLTDLITTSENPPL